MTEFTIHIDSAEGLATDEGLTAVFEQLNDDERALGAAASVGEKGDYGATFQVNADGLVEAANRGAAIFGSALVAAGHPGDAIAHLEVVLEDAEVAAA